MNPDEKNIRIFWKKVRKSGNICAKVTISGYFWQSAFFGGCNIVPLICDVDMKGFMFEKVSSVLHLLSAILLLMA